MVETSVSWQQLSQRTQNWRRQYPTILRTDQLQPEALPVLAAQEVDEAAAEHLFEASLLYNFAAHASEVLDIIVFLYSYCLASGIEPNFSEAWSRANGQGARSPIYDQLYEKALNLGEGDVAGNVTDFLSFVISLSHHLPQEMDVAQGMEYVLQKNTANRPIEYYGAYGPEGRLLKEEEVLRKFGHTDRMLRILRSHYGSPLEPWMHEQFADLILDFEHAERNQGLLQSLIAEQDIELAQQIQLVLTDLDRPRVPTSRLMRQLEVAGAYQLSDPASQGMVSAA